MATHKPFRELVKPGTNFDFVGRARIFTTISLLAVAASVAMLFVNKSWRGDYLNWSTDFKGGTEMVFAFDDARTGEPAEIDPALTRDSLKKGGFDGFEISDFAWDQETKTGEKRVHGILVRTPDFGALPRERQEAIADAYAQTFAKIEPLKVSWSGDVLYVRSMKPVDWKAAHEFFKAQSLELKQWEDDEQKQRFAQPEEGTGEYNAELSVAGIDAQYRDALQKGVGKDIKVKVVNVYGVGAKAGAQLRNDGITSIFYALLLVALYLVVRFDIRYAPGAIRALLLDSSIVVGVYAVAWTSFSLTTVAAILTVIGYSVNDTVVIYDRIRENMRIHKGKKMSRIVNLSVNEMLGRTLLTNLTVFATTLMMNIFGTGEVRNFAFAMNVAAVVGTYSSIFVAPPLALWIHNRYYGGPAVARGRDKGAADEAEADTDSGDDGEEAEQP